MLTSARLPGMGYVAERVSGPLQVERMDTGERRLLRRLSIHITPRRPPARLGRRGS